MRASINKPFFRKHGKKLIIAYICWSIIKGLFFLLLGYKLFS
jgi:hypothetical protein